MFRHRVAAAAAVAAGFGVAAKRALPRSNSSTTPLVARNQEEGAASSTQQAVVQCEAADSAAIAAAVGVGVGVAASMAAYLLYQRQPTAGGGWWSAFNGDAAEGDTLAELWAVLEQGDHVKLRRMLKQITPIVQVAVESSSSGGGGVDAPTAAAVEGSPFVGTVTKERRLRRGAFDLLQYAVVLGDLASTTAIIEWLEADVPIVGVINHPIDLRSNWMLLHSAAADGLPGLVKLLLSAGASPNFQASDGCTPVMLAALHGKASAAAALAAVDADLDIANKDGQTPLHFAALGGHLATVKVLLAAGAAPGCTDDVGLTPLMAATKHADNVEMVVALLEAGASPNAALHSSYRTAVAEPIEEDHDNGNAAAAVAGDEPPKGAGRGTAAMPEAVIETKSAAATAVEVKAKEEEEKEEEEEEEEARPVGAGKTALHFACQAGGSIQVAAALLQHGADASAADDAGLTPLMVCAGLGHVELVQLLLQQAGVDVDAKQAGGATAVMLAVRFNKPEVLWVLLEAGADHATYNNWALHTAQENGSEQCEVMLLAAAEVDARDAAAAAAVDVDGGNAKDTAAASAGGDVGGAAEAGADGNDGKEI